MLKTYINNDAKGLNYVPDFKITAVFENSMISAIRDVTSILDRIKLTGLILASVIFTWL